MTADLIEFLRARLDEDEAGVRALKVPHDWHTGPGDDPDWTNECMVLMWPPEFHTPYERDKHWRGETVADPETATHIARHDPARVLREVEAKRRVLDAYVEVAEMDTPDPEPEFAYGRAVGLGEVIRLLALPYNDHPDYRQEWAP